MVNSLMNRICNNRHEQQEGNASDKFSRRKNYVCHIAPESSSAPYAAMDLQALFGL